MGKKINDQKRQDNQKSNKKKHFVRNLLLTVALLMLFVLSFGGYKTYAYINEAPELEDKELSLPQSSTIYDAEGNKITDIVGKEHRKVVSYDEIPENVVNAFIAVEDVRYWEHNGVDLKRIGGAVVANIQDGFGAEGASTITQQVVKNMMLEPQKTLKRKVQEAYLAIQLEKNYTKEEILEMYLNKIYFGQGAYGIATAAHTYFNKSLDELSTAEAALLAGLPQRPSGYDPYKHPDLATDRRATVLNLMEKNGFISKEEHKKAESVAVKDMIVEQKSQPTTNDAFIDRVIDDLEKAGIPENALYSGGLEIYTTLDQKAQGIVDKALTTNDVVNYPDEKFRAGVSLIDTQSGAIRAIGGNRQSGEDDVQKGFNYATQLKRSPGSTIKPILDYGPAIEKFKWSTNKQLVDEKLTLNGKLFSNWNNEFQGSVSIREALKWSYNIPAIKTFMKVGGEEAQAFAKKLGISIEETYPSYAIGGFSKGISPLQLSGAYAAFGAGGNFHQPYSVEKVVYPNGKEMKLASEPERAMSEGTAYMITDMLRTVVDEGTGMQAAIDGLDVAGKTGTTSLDESINGEGTPDEWFSGYTTNYTAAIWTGYDQTTQNTYVHKKDDDIAKLLFHHIMSKVSEGKETSTFKKPDSVVELKIDEQTGLRANKATPSSQIVKELFFKGEEPEKSAIPEPKKKEPVKQQEDQSDKAKDNEKKSSNQPADKTEKEEDQKPSNRSKQTETKKEKTKSESANKEVKKDPVEETNKEPAQEPANDEADKQAEKQETQDPVNDNTSTGDTSEEPVDDEDTGNDPTNESSSDTNNTDDGNTEESDNSGAPSEDNGEATSGDNNEGSNSDNGGESTSGSNESSGSSDQDQSSGSSDQGQSGGSSGQDQSSGSSDQNQSSGSAEESQNDSTSKKEPVKDSKTSGDPSAQEEPTNAPDKKKKQDTPAD